MCPRLGGGVVAWGTNTIQVLYIPPHRNFVRIVWGWGTMGDVEGDGLVQFNDLLIVLDACSSHGPVSTHG